VLLFYATIMIGLSEIEDLIALTIKHIDFARLWMSITLTNRLGLVADV